MQAFAQGANPAHGRALAGPTAAARAVASVQCGLGASAPLHLEMSPAALESQDGGALAALVEAFLALGGTQLNLNIVSRARLESALADPDTHRDLAVRVTGFSAYFVNLTPEVQQEILLRHGGGAVALPEAGIGERQAAR